MNSIKQYFFSDFNKDYLFKIISQNIYQKYKNDSGHNFIDEIMLSKEDIYQIQHQIFEKNNKNLFNDGNPEEIMIKLNQQTVFNCEMVFKSFYEKRLTQNQLTSFDSKYNKLQQYEDKIQEDKSQQDKYIQTENSQDITKKDNIKEDNTKEDNTKGDITKYNKIFHLFSEENEKGNYIFNLKNEINNATIKFQIYKNFYNIIENNNIIEIYENNLKKEIIIPIGYYNLDSLINKLNELFNKDNKDKDTNSKYEILYNNDKNKLHIKSKNVFKMNIKSHQLKILLGFTNIDYINNNNYIGNLSPCLSIFDNIYIKMSINNHNNNDNNNAHNNFITNCLDENNNEFKYFKYICLKNTLRNEYYTSDNLSKINCNFTKLTISFYYKNVNSSIFHKIKQQIDFSIKLIE